MVCMIKEEIEEICIVSNNIIRKAKDVWTVYQEKKFIFNYDKRVIVQKQEYIDTYPYGW